VTEPRDTRKRTNDEIEPAFSTEPLLWEALVAAYRPQSLDPNLNESLIADALEDPLREPSEDERAESERFRDALEGHAPHEDLALVEALTRSHRSTAVEGSELVQVSEDALANALAKAGAVSKQSSTSVTKSNVVYVTFGVITAVALAAAGVMLVTFPVSVAEKQVADVALTKPGAARPALTQSRSTAAHFRSKFERNTTTERMDIIASIRTRELRENRYAQWGIR
jgi:hypothetical protein